MAWIAKIFTGGANRNAGGAVRRGEDTYPLISDDQPRNPYTEVKVLSGHISTVHQIEIIDERRFISASNDGSTIVWDNETGQKLHVLKANGAVVTSVLSIQSYSDTSELCIITAYADTSLKFWSLNDNDPLQDKASSKTVNEHDGLVKCLLQMGNDIVCSGGKDLCLWDRNGSLLSKFNRNELAEDTSNIHSLLKLEGVRHFGVVAASDYISLAVYDINKLAMTETNQYKLEFVRYLYSSHKDNISCLATISKNSFASGSCDGVILLWSINSLSAMKMFSCADFIPTASLKESHPPGNTSITQIKRILAIGDRYIFVAVGLGFRVYDVVTYEDARGQPKPLATFSNAHQQPITCIDFVEERGILVTASEDNSVRLWGHSTRISRDSDNPSPAHESNTNPSKIHIEDFLGIELHSSKNRKKGGIILPIKPTLLGELLLHSNQVKVVKNLGEHGLVTCGADGLILLWKDEEQQRELRDIEIKGFLKGQSTTPSDTS